MISILERVVEYQTLTNQVSMLRESVARTLVKDLALAKTFNPLVRLSSKYAELKAGNSLDVLGNVMMNEQSTKLLVELGKTNPQSKAAINKLQIIDSVSPFVERTTSIITRAMTLRGTNTSPINHAKGHGNELVDQVNTSQQHSSL